MQPGIKDQAVRFSRARSNLLLVIAFTVVNLMLVLVNADLFFLFSATVPTIILVIAMDLAIDFGNTVLLVGIAIAFACVLVYGASWLFSKKKRGFILLALIFFIIDTLAFTGIVIIDMLFSGDIFNVSFLIQVGFVIWILYYLITGTSAWLKLRKYDPAIVDVASREAEVEAMQVNEQKAVSEVFTNGENMPMTTSIDFPFAESENVAVFTCVHVLEHNEDICYVSHNEGDGAWQFLCKREHNISDARVISLKEIYGRDPSVGSLADMPLGNSAVREDKLSLWMNNSLK